jgi:hypothetical protein
VKAEITNAIPDEWGGTQAPEGQRTALLVFSGEKNKQFFD